MKFLSDNKGRRRLFLPLFLMLCLISIPEFVYAAAQNEAIDRAAQDKLVEPAIPNAELRKADKFWDEAERFILIGDIQAYGSYSELDGDDDIWGGSFYGLVAPGIKLGDRMIFIAMYDGQFDRRMDLYSDDYGYRKTTESQRHAFTPMLRIDFGEDSRYSITPSFFYTETWNKDEGQNSSWDSGLYNYKDKGGGLDFDMKECMGEFGNLKIGAQYYAREYPNYTSLLYDSGSAIGYEDEKDYHGIIGKLGYYWIKDAGFSWLANYTLLYKRFDDKLITESNGVLSSSSRQRDYVHEMNVNFWYFFEDIGGGLNVGLNLNGRLYRSNENYVNFDGIADWDVNEDYFDYDAYRIGPNIAYLFESMPLTASFSYSYGRLDYSDRWARDSTGSWSERKKQWEHTHDVTVGLKFEVSEKLSLLGQWQYIKNRSNNDDESVYVYDYKVNIVLIGARYSF